MTKLAKVRAAFSKQARRTRRRFERLAAGLNHLRTDPQARERASAMAAFACILAFGAASLDYLITGGPDWNPGAAAAPLAQPVLTLSRPEAAAYEAPPTLQATLLEEAAFDGPIPDLLGGPETLPALLSLDAEIDALYAEGKPAIEPAVAIDYGAPVRAKIKGVPS